MSSEYVLHSTEGVRDFGTGSIRGDDTDKPRPDFLSPYALERFGRHMMLGAKRYGEFNWEKGQPVTQFIASLERHLNAYKRGLYEEDHLSAIMYGAQAIMHFEELAKLGDETALKMLDRYASKNLAEDLIYEREAQAEADEIEAFQREKRAVDSEAQFDNEYPFIEIEGFVDLDDYDDEDDPKVYNPPSVNPSYIGRKVRVVRDVMQPEYDRIANWEIFRNAKNELWLKKDQILEVVNCRSSNGTYRCSGTHPQRNYDWTYDFVKPEWIEIIYNVGDEVVITQDVTWGMLGSRIDKNSVFIEAGMTGKVHRVGGVGIDDPLSIDVYFNPQCAYWLKPEWIDLA
jgi:hypothetical protein